MQRIALRAANRLKDLLYVPGTARAHLEDARGKVACLLYHRVVDPAEDRFDFLTRGGVPAISPRELASDIAFLAQKGAKFFTFEDLQEGSFPSRGEFGVIVCFDDCFRDNYEARARRVGKAWRARRLLSNVRPRGSARFAVGACTLLVRSGQRRPRASAPAWTPVLGSAARELMKARRSDYLSSRACSLRAHQGRAAVRGRGCWFRVGITPVARRTVSQSATCPRRASGWSRDRQPWA